MTEEESKAEDKREVADVGGGDRKSTVLFDLPDEPSPSQEDALSTAPKPALRSSLMARSFRVDPNEMVTAKYFQDHYSLLVPSSSVRFRGSTKESFETHGCHVIENENHQIILEERLHVSQESADGTSPASTKRTIQIKRVRSSSKGLQLLRAIYTIVCALFAGLFLAFAVQLTLNIVLDMAIISGDTNQGSTSQWWHAPPLLLALIQFCHTFAEGMVLVTRFVIDAWSGHYLVKEFFPAPPLMRKNLVFVDWLFFAFLLGIPLVTMIITMFAGLDNCWVITGVVWYSSVGLFFAAFAVSAIYYEIRGAIVFVMNHDYPDQKGSVAFSRDTFWQACKRCIIMRQTRRYSGKKRVRYFAKTLMERETDSDVDEDVDEQDKVLGKDTVEIVEGSYSEKTGFWSSISASKLFTTNLELFRVLDVPKKLYNIDDAQGMRPFVTKWTWSLERMYCNPASSRYVAIVHGPGSLTKNQVLSSLGCSILGTVLVTLLIVSFLVWFGLTWWLVVFVLVLLLAWIVWNVMRLRKSMAIIYKLNKTKKDFQPEDKITEWFVGSKDDDSVEAAEGPSEKPESDEKDRVQDDEEKGNLTERQSEKEILRETAKDVDRRDYLQRHASEYIEGPSIGLYIVGKSMRLTEASESVCWFMMFWEIVLFYVWPIVVLYLLQTSGVATVYMIGVGISGFRHYFNIVAVIEETGTMNLKPGRSRRKRWLKQARLTDIVDEISTDKSKRVWLAVLASLSVIFLLLFIGGLVQGDTAEGDSVELTYLPEWYYPPQKESAQYPSCIFGKPPSQALQNYSLADMAFLASLSYRNTSVVDKGLKGWFGPAGTNVTDEYEYVDDWKAETGATAKFRLFRFPNEEGDTGIVSVRGTAGALDLLVDNQLWQAAMLAQLVRLALPFGEIFTPVLPTLVQTINALQGDAVQRVSYYKGVTNFVNELKKNPDYAGMALTGHSLGGGIAIISAAQTGVGAVAVSGPNAMLSRLSFDPQLEVGALNNNTFNIVPKRDLVPMFDDKAQNYQNIDCRSGGRNPLSCHSVVRTICELQYTCGTSNRPALCECFKSYGFPMPQTDGDQDFEEMCADANTFS